MYNGRPNITSPERDTACAAASGDSISTQPWPKKVPCRVFHTMCVIPGNVSISTSSVILLLHIFFKYNLVISPGLEVWGSQGFFAPLCVALCLEGSSVTTAAEGFSRPFSFCRFSYVCNNSDSLSRMTRLEKTPCSTQRSHRIVLPNRFVPSWSAM